LALAIVAAADKAKATGFQWTVSIPVDPYTLVFRFTGQQRNAHARLVDTRH
jgi:hypothetical protein